MDGRQDISESDYVQGSFWNTKQSDESDTQAPIQEDTTPENPEDLLQNLIDSYNGTRFNNLQVPEEITVIDNILEDSDQPGPYLKGFEIDTCFSVNGTSFRILNHRDKDAVVFHSAQGYQSAVDFFSSVFSEAGINTSTTPAERVIFFKHPTEDYHLLQIHHGNGTYTEDPTYIIDSKNRKLIFAKLPFLAPPTPPNVLVNKKDIDIFIRDKEYDGYESDISRRAHEY